jgi:sulfotransferase family protein
MTSVRPNFLLIGAARCGTTALADLLMQHPDVFVTEPKEPHFWAFAGDHPAFSGPGDDLSVNRVSVTDPDAYLALYRKAGRARARGDGSVSTLYYAEKAIPNIQRYAPESRLIVSLRDPVERAFSSYQYLRARGFEPCDEFEAALDAESERVTAGWHHLWHYTRMGFYAEQIEPFLSTFGTERVKVVFAEQLGEAPDSVAGEIFEFLRLVPAPGAAVRERMNASGQPRLGALRRLDRALVEAPRVRDAVRRVVPLHVRQRIRSANLAEIDIPAGARERLTELYAPEIERLRVLLNSDGPAWLTEVGAR